MTDGISENTDESVIPVGAYVYDTEDTDPNTAIAVHRSENQANEHSIEGTGKTVAEFNTDYDPTADVVVVVFKSEFEDIDAWQVSTTESLYELVQDNDLREYAYPEPRLRYEGETAITPRTTDDGKRFIHRLHVTNVGEKLAFGLDYDGVDHQYGMSREVCFHLKDRPITEDSTIHIEYEREKYTIKDLPPLLVGIDDYRVIEDTASPDFLMDL